MPLAITPTFSPRTHTSDDSYIYQLSLVLATAIVSLLIYIWGSTLFAYFRQIFGPNWNDLEVIGFGIPFCCVDGMVWTSATTCLLRKQLMNSHFVGETGRFVTMDALSTIFLLLCLASLFSYFFPFIPVCLSSSCSFVCAAVICYSQQVRIL